MCTSPRVLIHPNAQKHIYSGSVDSYQLFSKTFPIFSRHVTLRGLLKKFHDINTSYPDIRELHKHCYLFNSEDGSVYPLFFYAPCNKCPDCLRKKYSELSARLQCEAFSHPPTARPIFFTLTYKNEFLPEGGNVSKSDITEFTNKLSIYLHRNGILQTPRIFIASEYGPYKTRRPHYHGLIFGLELLTKEQRQAFNKSIRQAWPKCVYERLTWEFARSSIGVARYCTKYVLKQFSMPDSVPPGRLPNFYSTPRRSGALGSLVLKKPDILHNILNSEDGTMSVFDSSYDKDGKLTKSIRKCNIPKFLIDKLFPYASKFFTSNIKRCLRLLCDFHNTCCRLSISHNYDMQAIYTKFSWLFNNSSEVSDLNYCGPFPLEHNRNLFYFKSLDPRTLLNNFKILYDWLISRPFDSNFVSEQLKVRTRYFSQILPDYEYSDCSMYNKMLINKLNTITLFDCYDGS